MDAAFGGFETRADSDCRRGARDGAGSGQTFAPPSLQVPGRSRSGGEDDVSQTDGPAIAEWRADPFGRFEYRRFFLGGPTSLVKTGQAETVDPVSLLLAFGENKPGPAPSENKPGPQGPSVERHTDGLDGTTSRRRGLSSWTFRRPCPPPL